MRPFFPYYGSKWALARRYPPPAYSRVIEPFAGAAGYATYYGCRDVLLFDADPIIAGLWDYLIRSPAADILALPDMPAVGDSVDNYSLPQEAKWLIGFWLNRGSASPKKSRTAYSARSDKAQLNWGPRAKERIAAQLPSIRGWRVRNASFDAAPYMRATWFVDPPYADKGRHYAVQFSDFDRLGAWCRGRAGQVIACEGPGAAWLPFEPLGTFKTSRGMSDEFVFLGGRL